MALDLNAQKQEFAATVNEAVASIKSQVEDLARFVALKKDETAKTLGVARGRAGRQFKEIAEGAHAIGDRRLARISQSVADYPLIAVAIAAGAGFVIGLMARGGRQ